MVVGGLQGLKNAVNLHALSTDDLRRRKRTVGNDMLNGYWEYCREERQFAVFLYNVFWESRKKEITTLDSNHEKIIRECLNFYENSECTIEDVYFEATLMRDYFAICQDKADFNKKLLAFCFGWWNSSSNSVKSFVEQIIDELDEVDTSHKFCTRNLGQKEAKKAISDIYTEYLKTLKEKKEVSNEIIEGMQKKASLEIARMMMNATPDILVKYRIGESTTYVKALECKLTSEEGRYEDVAGVKCKMQLFIQDCIMHFCFGKGEGQCHIPSKPSGRSIWKSINTVKIKDVDDAHEILNEEGLWEIICGRVYRGILKQGRKSVKLINMGAEMIQLEKVKSDDEPIIKIDENINLRVKRNDKLPTEKL